jgi:hypothetical protein
LQAGVNLYLYARGSPIVMVDPNGMKEEEWSIGRLVERGIQALPGGGSSGEGAAHISGDAPPVESDEAKRVLEQFREPAEVGIPLEWDFGTPQVDLSLEGQAGFHHENLQQAFEAREARVAAEIAAKVEAAKRDPLADVRESVRQGRFPLPPEDPFFEDSGGRLYSPRSTPDGQVQYEEQTRFLMSTLPGRGGGRAAAIATRATSAENAIVLSRNLEREGRAAGPGQAAGHIVPSTGSQGHWAAGARSRDLLQQYGIGVNDAANGIPIGQPRPHNVMHTRQYLGDLEDRLTALQARMLDQGYGSRAIRGALRRELRAVGRETLAR